MLRPTPGDPWGVEQHHWNTGAEEKPTVEPRWAKQQTKKLRPKPTKINSFMSGPSLSLTPDPPKPMYHTKTCPLIFIFSHLCFMRPKTISYIHDIGMARKFNPNYKIIWVRYFSKKLKIVIFRLKIHIWLPTLAFTQPFRIMIIDSCFVGRWVGWGDGGSW